MAAQAWKLYNIAKDNIGNSTVSLSGDIWKIALFKSTSNASVLTSLSIGNVTNQVDNGVGYVTGGITLSATTWGEGTSAKAMQFDATAAIWTAAAGDITSIQFAVIYSSGGNELLCFSSLSSAIFSVTDTNTLTITPHATSGIFEMV